MLAIAENDNSELNQQIVDFIKKFGKQGKFSTVPLDMIHGAFDELDQDGDGDRSPS